MPGFVAGMEYIQQKYGTKSMSDLIQPAVEYAEKGFEVDSLLSSRLYYSRGRMDVDDLSAFYPKGEAIEEGETLSQPVLAKTLIKIQREGASAFYKGDLAQDLADATPISKRPIFLSSDRNQACRFCLQWNGSDFSASAFFRDYTDSNVKNGRERKS